LNCYFGCLISCLYMRVLKLTLGKLFFCKFFLCFQLLVWTVWTDLFLSPDAHGSVDRWFDNMSSWRMSNTFGHKPFAFFAIRTTLHFFSYFCHVVCFSRGFLPRFWHSLHISSYSIIFSLFSFVLLICYPL
jgi:hypothetical protein